MVSTRAAPTAGDGSRRTCQTATRGSGRRWLRHVYTWTQRCRTSSGTTTWWNTGWPSTRYWHSAEHRPAERLHMLRVGIEQHPLMVTAALVWSEELPRPLQQILF